MPQEKPRSGYAFSHQEGFATLITSGHIFGMNTSEIDREQFRRRSVIGTPASSSPSRGATPSRSEKIQMEDFANIEVVPPAPVTQVELMDVIKEDNATSSASRGDENVVEDKQQDAKESNNSQEDVEDPQ